MNTPTQQTGGESATPRTDEAQILASFNEVEPPHYPRAFLAVTADFARQLERETATLHAQLGEARAELERVQTANNGDSSLPHFDSVVIPTEADADIKALGALLTPEGLGLYNRIARRNYDARRRERDELRAELLTTHQMACRVGLERDELRAKQGEAP